MIPLVKDTLTQLDIKNLQEWLGTNPRLTKGILTEEFEHKWSQWLGIKHSTFVNSGSSANFLMFDALKNTNRFKSKNVVVPAVSWVTTVSPVMQLGLNPILCDCNMEDLGLDLEHFEDILKKNEVDAAIIVHVLGVPNKMDEILFLCNKYNVILLEDCCEAHGSTYNNRKVGTFGLISSFSYYYGHHISTIEGGMVCTDDLDLDSIVKSIRSHGWARDLPVLHKKNLEEKFNISAFDSLYTFYYAGYNFRSTDLNAFLGISQLNQLEEIIKKRNANYLTYKSKLKEYWFQNNPRSFISNFAYGMIAKNKNEIIKRLYDNKIECRPLICGSIGLQPFWIKEYGETHLTNADKVHTLGFYIPNNPDLLQSEIEEICSTILQK